MTNTNHNFALVLDAMCERHPARLALFSRYGTLRYGELARLIEAHAAALAASGAGPGRCVALLLPNSPAFVAAFFGALRLGASVAPIGILLKPREVGQRLALVDAAVLVTTAARAGELAEAEIEMLVVDASGDGLASRGRAPVASRAEDDTAVLVLTSGTTGAPKAAEISHAGLAWNGRALVDGFALTAADVQLAAAPLSHVLGMSGVMNATLVTGGALALIERFDAADALSAIAQTGTTGVMGAPAMFAALVREARKTTIGAPPLRFAHTGGAPLPGELARAIAETFGCVAREGYGMSEVGGGITLAPLWREAKPGSVGQAFPGSSLRIVDTDTGVPLAAGERGEVQVRSPSVMRGYRGDEVATRAVLDPDRWLYTGDVGYLDADGDLFLVDRKKDIIIRSGYNVYPREVEAVILTCPGVLDVAVMGLPDDERGEEVVALVVPARDDLNPEAVKAFARERLAAYKYPRHVVMVKDLARGPTGKIAKHEIDVAALIARP